MGSDGPRLCWRGSVWILGDISSPSVEALAQAAQRGGGVTIPRSVQEMWRCGTWGRGGNGSAVGLDFSGLFPA